MMGRPPFNRPPGSPSTQSKGLDLDPEKLYAGSVTLAGAMEAQGGRACIRLTVPLLPEEAL